MKINRSALRESICLALALAAFSGAQTHNTLTSSEKDAGYILLFNGADLNNWKTYQATSAPPSWTVKTEGSSKHIEVGAGGQKHLISKQADFQNFDLKIDWLVPTKGNSGIFIRYMEIAEWGGASGPEAQVVDINHSDGQQALHRAGTCYDLFPLERDNWWRPTGQWNEFRIVAYNNKIAHYGNGKKVIEYDMSSKAFTDAYAVSKYRTYPNYKTVHPGAIYLQHHGEIGIKYRNIKIKKLDKDPWAAGSPYLKADGTLTDDLAQADNIFPAPGTFLGALAPASGAVAFRRGADGLTVLLPRAGGDARHTLRLSDPAGRVLAVETIAGASWTVPSGLARSAPVLTVTSGGRTLHAGLLPAP